MNKVKQMALICCWGLADQEIHLCPLESHQDGKRQILTQILCFVKKKKHSLQKKFACDFGKIHDKGMVPKPMLF